MRFTNSGRRVFLSSRFMSSLSSSNDSFRRACALMRSAPRLLVMMTTAFLKSRFYPGRP
jgi:hypothetical protein